MARSNGWKPAHADGTRVYQDDAGRTLAQVRPLPDRTGWVAQTVGRGGRCPLHGVQADGPGFCCPSMIRPVETSTACGTVGQAKREALYALARTPRAAKGGA